VAVSVRLHICVGLGRAAPRVNKRA
jgi:hypothetical protein